MSDNPQMTPERYAEVVAAVEREIAKVIVGQHDVVRSVIVAMLCEGHVLLEGVPVSARPVCCRVSRTRWRSSSAGSSSHPT